MSTPPGESFSDVAFPPVPEFDTDSLLVPEAAFGESEVVHLLRGNVPGSNDQELRATIIQPVWRLADEYGRGGVIRLAPGDSISITVSTEVGLSLEESRQLAEAHGVTLQAWIAQLESKVADTYGFRLQTTLKRSVSYTTNFLNSDPAGRTRYVSLWRPNLSCLEWSLEPLRFVDTNFWDTQEFDERFDFLWSNEALFESNLWVQVADAEISISGQSEWSDMYT
jgi:hypothetical protein